MHFNGQSTVTIDGDSATGESYTIAHHVFSEDGTRKIMIASLRYLDTFVKIDQGWYFAERNLILDWSETRSLGTNQGELMAQQLSFATDIRPLFRDRDIQSMESAFDLASYNDVKTHGDAIYAVLAAGQMPCDGAWAEEDVQRFRSWLDAGALP